MNKSPKSGLSTEELIRIVTTGTPLKRPIAMNLDQFAVSIRGWMMQFKLGAGTVEVQASLIYNHYLTWAMENKIANIAKLRDFCAYLSRHGKLQKKKKQFFIAYLLNRNPLNDEEKDPKKKK